jgi:hypothetical protein
MEHFPDDRGGMREGEKQQPEQANFLRLFVGRERERVVGRESETCT